MVLTHAWLVCLSTMLSSAEHASAQSHCLHSCGCSCERNAGGQQHIKGGCAVRKRLIASLVQQLHRPTTSKSKLACTLCEHVPSCVATCLCII